MPVVHFGKLPGTECFFPTVLEIGRTFKNKKTDVAVPARELTTSAYLLTSIPIRPGCSSFNLPNEEVTIRRASSNGNAIPKQRTKTIQRNKLVTA